MKAMSIPAQLKRAFAPVALGAMIALAAEPAQGKPTGADLVQAHFTATDLAGRSHAAAEAGAQATVWVFISHDCPICNSYAPELNRLKSEFSPRGVQLNLVYTDSELSTDLVRAHAKEHGYSEALFDDADHRIAKACHVAVTPEVIVITADQAVAYRGRIDNRYVQPGRERAQTTSFDLRVALDAILDHRPVLVAQTAAVGCALELP